MQISHNAFEVQDDLSPQLRQGNWLEIFPRDDTLEDSLLLNETSGRHMFQKRFAIVRAVAEAIVRHHLATPWE